MDKRAKRTRRYLHHRGTEERRNHFPCPLFLRGGEVLLVLLALLSTVGGAYAQAPTRKPDANLLQLMRGILYPASNVIFAAQEDLSKQPKPADEATSPNPLTSTYG